MSDQQNPYESPKPASSKPTDASYGPSPTKTRWIMFALASSASFLTYIHRYSWGVVRPDVKAEYGLNDADLGWLDAGFNLTYAFGQFPGGLMGDFFGPQLIIPLAAIAWSFMMVAPALWGSFWPLMGSRLLFGVAQAPAYPNLGKITKSWFPVSIRTSVQGVVASLAGRAGAGIAPILIATLLIGTLGFSWRAALYMLAGTGLVYAVIFYFLFRNRPADHPWCNEAERELIQSGESSALHAEKPRFVWTRATVTNLVLFMAASFCSTFADNLFVFWMPQFLIEEKGFGPVEMGFFASLPLWGGALGGFCGGMLNDLLIRVTGNRRLARSLVACTGKTLAAVLIAASLLANDGRMVMVVLFFCKFFSDWTQPTWWGTVTDLGGPAAGRVFGMVNTVGSIGAFTAGPVMGYVKFYGGWGPLFYFVGGVYILTAVFWAFVNCTRRLVADETDQPLKE